MYMDKKEEIKKITENYDSYIGVEEMQLNPRIKFTLEQFEDMCEYPVECFDETMFMFGKKFKDNPNIVVRYAKEQDEDKKVHYCFYLENKSLLEEIDKKVIKS